VALGAGEDVHREGARQELRPGGAIGASLNPETTLPLGSGRVVWTVPGSITVGLGDNRGFGGSNASDFELATQHPGAILEADGTSVAGAMK
jgi:hypothetical protein